jgi:hypothetical protein
MITVKGWLIPAMSVYNFYFVRGGELSRNRSYSTLYYYSLNRAWGLTWIFRWINRAGERKKTCFNRTSEYKRLFCSHLGLWREFSVKRFREVRCTFSGKDSTSCCFSDQKWCLGTIDTFVRSTCHLFSIPDSKDCLPDGWSKLAAEWRRGGKRASQPCLVAWLLPSLLVLYS